MFSSLIVIFCCPYFTLNISLIFLTFTLYREEKKDVSSCEGLRVGNTVSQWKSFSFSNEVLFHSWLNILFLYVFIIIGWFWSSRGTSWMS